MKYFIFILIMFFCCLQGVVAQGSSKIIINTSAGEKSYEISQLKNIKYDNSKGSYVMLVNLKDGSSASFDIEKLLTMRFSVPAPATKRGDSNDDGNITVTDIVSIANYILGSQPLNFSFANSDADRDGKVTVTDIVFIAQYILCGEWPTIEHAKQIIINDEMLRRFAELDDDY